jgi:hypothetical protein
VAPESVWMLRRENSLPFQDSKSDPSIVQPIASCYTQCSILRYEMMYFFLSVFSEFPVGKWAAFITRNVQSPHADLVSSWPK